METDTAAQRTSLVNVSRNAPQGAANNSNESRAPETMSNWRNNYPDWNPTRSWWKNSWKFQDRQRDFERSWRDQPTSTWEPGTPHGSMRGREDQHIAGCEAPRKRYPTPYPRVGISEELEEETPEGVPAITTITSIRSVKFPVGLPEQEPSSTLIERDDRSPSRSKSPRGQSIHPYDRCRHQEGAGINQLRSAQTGTHQCEMDETGAEQKEMRGTTAVDQLEERAPLRNQREGTTSGAHQKKRVRSYTELDEENATTGDDQLVPQLGALGQVVPPMGGICAQQQQQAGAAYYVPPFGGQVAQQEQPPWQVAPPLGAPFASTELVMPSQQQQQGAGRGMDPKGAGLDTAAIIRASQEEMLPDMRIPIEQGIAKGMQAVAEMQERAAVAAATRVAPIRQGQVNLRGASSTGRTRRPRARDKPGEEESEDTGTETPMEASTLLPAELQGLSEEVFFGNECYRTQRRISQGDIT